MTTCLPNGCPAPQICTHIVTSQFVITSNHQNPFPHLSCLFPFHPFYVFSTSCFTLSNFFLLFTFLYIHLLLTHIIQNSTYHTTHDPSQSKLYFIYTIFIPRFLQWDKCRLAFTKWIYRDLS